MDRLVRHYDQCFLKNGDCHKGVDWPNKSDAQVRYQVMFEGIPYKRYSNQNKLSLLDYGCGLGHFHEYLASTNSLDRVNYYGCDASFNMIKHCKTKLPEDNFFVCSLNGQDVVTKYDYIICNGVFTEKLDYSYDEMFIYTSRLMVSLFNNCAKGMMVNFMSTNVDWRREDLFHMPLDQICSFISKNISRHFVIRNDYGLYEYTIYIYRSPFHRYSVKSTIKDT